ncbi:MAG: type III-A CRISPR-associated protein Csm2 [Chloroflexi bacterium]|nr:type III-A CRISPR-associated protein Csm2 [Chloroflexota bacterium]
MSVQQIMTADETGEKLVKFADETADKLVRASLTRAQIRNIFTEVRQIESLWGMNRADALRRLNMLKPKLAYQTARTPQMKDLQSVLSEAITLVSNAASDDEKDQRFERFMDLFEAILAYHRAKGGRN